VVLEVRSFTPGRVGDGLHVERPTPSGLEGIATNFAAADLHDLGPPMGKVTNLVGLCKRSMFGLLHGNRLRSVVHPTVG
jgi:hypothetical protein